MGCVSAQASNLGEPVSTDWSDLRIKHDEFRNISFIQSVALSSDVSNSPVSLYISQIENTDILRFRAEYLDIGWIFLDNAIFINDQGKNIQYSFDISEVDRSVFSGRWVKEVVDVVFSHFTTVDGIGQHSDINKIKDLQELLNGTNIRLRLSGDKYREYNISDSHVTALKNMIAYYESITLKIE